MKIKAALGLLATPFIYGLPIFLAAGTTDYWQGWVSLVVYSLCIVFHSLFLLKDPELLERRMRAGPTREELPGYDQYCKKVRWRLFPWLF